MGRGLKVDEDGVIRDIWKITKLPTHEKVVTHHRPADYIAKVLREPFKLENQSTWVSTVKF